MTKLEAAVASFREKILLEKLLVISQKEIAFGRQLMVSDDVSSSPVNIYSGKQGIKIVVGGSANGLRDRLLRLAGKPSELSVDAAPSPVNGRPPGFEYVEDFDGRWIGTDESGKGDLFGPLVVAGVLVTDESAARLASIGVQDSKKLTDKANRSIAVQIRELCVGQYVELEILPQRYNKLYQEMAQENKNLNHLLAWAHARVLEDLLETADCSYAIADQFANERYILSRLMTKGRQIKLVQTHKAERNVAVAAASMLARDRYLGWMEKTAQEFELKLPKGAAPQVVTAGQEFIARFGRERLPEVAKMHFRTIEQL